MPTSDLPLPTDAELQILRVLWAHGSCTVRKVQEQLPTDSGYTTVLKFLQIMHAKDLVTRDESQRAHVYTAAVSEERAQGQLVDDLMHRAFGGSARKLVLRALSSRRSSPEELEAIRDLLDKMEVNDA